ncbi:MAG: SDR family NAD(P)-dependent oxidoreductase, partial [Myxococcota bacterium]
VPGAFYLAVFLAVAESHWADQPIEVRDVEFVRPLAFTSPSARTVLHVLLSPGDSADAAMAASLSTRSEDDGWLTHVTAVIGPVDRSELVTHGPSHTLAGEPEVDEMAHIELLRSVTIEWGPKWRWLRQAMCAAERTSLGAFAVPDGVPTDDAPIPGGLIDNAFGLGLWSGPTSKPGEYTPRIPPGNEVPRLPFAVERLVWYGRDSLPALADYVVRSDADMDGDIIAADLTMWDAGGTPVAHVDGFTTRRAPPQRFLADQTSRHLYTVSWVGAAMAADSAGDVDSGDGATWALIGAAPDRAAGAGREMVAYSDLAALQAALDDDGDGAVPPAVVVMAFADDDRSSDDSDSDLATVARTISQDGLAALQAWLADERLAHSQLVWVTRSAIAVGADDRALDLAHAPLWGLMRTAQSEHPERSLTVADMDTDGELGALVRALPAALAADEPQLAMRDGQLRVPRLARAGANAEVSESESAALDTRGTILITGGTGALGALIARDLVAEHGARHLLLTSRSGMSSERAQALHGELQAAGAQVTIAACDMADRAAVAELLDTVPDDRPLTAIFHTAGVLDDGVITSLSADMLDRVARPKIDAAINLHELTAGRDLSAFVLFSSASGVTGNPGQGNYAAANTFLDALASQRRADGLPAVSLAWGPWADGGMAARLSDSDRERMRRQGVPPLSAADGLALLHASLGRAEALLVPIHFDLRALSARAESVPAIARGLVRTRRTRAASSAQAAAGSASVTSMLAQRLAGLSAEERIQQLLDLVRTEVAQVLGIASPGAVEAERPLSDLGLDSLMAVELRNRLSAVTGLRLPATLLFDYPTPAAVTGLLDQELSGEDAQPEPAQRIRVVHGDEDDPIAIVAIGCRYPGGVSDPNSFWQLLSDGTDAISDFPDNRNWDVDTLFDPDPDAKGKSYVREGGFLHDAHYFDPHFFGISPREALAIDPQQRLLLETSWEALERARIAPGTLIGSQTGVFVGVMYTDYGTRLMHGGPHESEGYIGIGSGGSVASGRIAYTLGLQGPAVTVDTACSSSLVTLHLACQALRNHECDLALAGG